MGGAWYPAPMQLIGKDRRYLRSLGHSLKPVVWIGKEGLTPAVLRSIEDAHRGAELIKLKILDPAEQDRKAIATKIERGSKSNVVGMVGGILLLYRKDPEKPRIQLPGR